jgi:hypothetical protein
VDALTFEKPPFHASLGGFSASRPLLEIQDNKEARDLEDGGDDGGGAPGERAGYVAAIVVLFLCRFNTTRKPDDAKDGGDNGGGATCERAGYVAMSNVVGLKNTCYSCFVRK